MKFSEPPAAPPSSLEIARQAARKAIGHFAAAAALANLYKSVGEARR